MVLRWTILIDSSLVGLTVLIEITALKTILVVLLLSRLMKSRWMCLIRNILTILNEITDCYGLKLLDVIMKYGKIISASSEWTLIIAMSLRHCRGKPMASKSVREINGKRKRNNDQAPFVEHGEILVGRKIRVWQAKDEIYRPGVVKSFDVNYNMHKVLSDDGLEVVIDLKLKRWMFDNLSAMPDSSAGPAPREVSSPQSSIICVPGYKVMDVYAPILEAILKKHGDIAATCVFTGAAIRTSLLEGVCDIVRRIETNDVTNIISSIDEIESQVYAAEAAKINVSWLRASLNDLHKRNEAEKKGTMLMDLKSNTTLVIRAAGTDRKERHANLVAAQNQFAEAQRCEEVLKLVEKKLNDDVLESMAEKDLWAQKPVI
nr:phospholipase-like protein [Tanacetum cinerariifolium]